MSDAREGRLQPVLHLLHLEEHEGRAGRVRERADAGDWPEFFRPNFFANTPDILHAYLQTGGRPAFEARLVLAATLSPSYGIYSGFESLENVPAARGQRGVPRLGEVRARRSARSTGRCCRSLARLNEIRRENRGAPAARRRALPRDGERAAARLRQAPRQEHHARVVNLDPGAAAGGRRDRPGALGLPPTFRVRDLLDGMPYTWHVGRNYVRLEPAAARRTCCGWRPSALEPELPRADAARRPAPRGRARRPRATTTNPHHVLGAHPADGGVVVRAYRPDARRSASCRRAASRSTLALADPGGSSRRSCPAPTCRSRYRLEVDYRGREHRRARDPYRFLPTLGELDLHLAGEGRHEELYEQLGAHVARARRRRRASASPSGRRPRGRSASSATSTAGTGACTRCARSARRGSGSCSSPASSRGSLQVRDPRGRTAALLLKADPLRVRAPRSRRRTPPSSSSRTTSGATTDGSERRGRRRSLAQPVSIYEVHLGSWRLNPLEGNRSLSYVELADELGDYVRRPRLHARRAAAGDGAPVRGLLGLPGDRLLRADGALRLARRLPRLRRPAAPARHRRDPRLGAGALPARRVRARALRRHGALRARGPAPRCAPGLGHARLQLRPQRGAQLPGRERALLAAGVPRRRPAGGRRGLDALPRLLARSAGEWVPNEYGGREDLEAIAFLARAERGRARREPGVLMAAEESTAWPGVSRPTDVRRARLRLQVEHGLDARHARLLPRTSRCTASTTTTSSPSA